MYVLYKLIFIYLFIYLFVISTKVGDLTELEDFQISYNLNMIEMPISVRKLNKIKRFHFCNTKFEEVPSLIENWTDLLELYLYDNTQIETLPSMMNE